MQAHFNHAHGILSERGDLDDIIVMDVIILAGQSNMAGRGGVLRLPDGGKHFHGPSGPSPAAAEGIFRKRTACISCF